MFNPSLGTPFILAHLHFKTSNLDVRLTNAPYDITYKGYVYKAYGDLLSVSSLNNSSNISNEGMSVTLSGLDPAYQRQIQDENYLNQPIKIYIVSVNEGVVTSDEIIHSGYLDQPVFSKDPQRGILTITCKTVNEFKRLDQTNGTKSANSVQQFWFPNDKGLEFAGKGRYVGKWK